MCPDFGSSPHAVLFLWLTSELSLARRNSSSRNSLARCSFISIRVRRKPNMDTRTATPAIMLDICIPARKASEYADIMAACLCWSKSCSPSLRSLISCGEIWPPIAFVILFRRRIEAVAMPMLPPKILICAKIPCAGAIDKHLEDFFQIDSNSRTCISDGCFKAD